MRNLDLRRHRIAYEEFGDGLRSHPAWVFGPPYLLHIPNCSPSMPTCELAGDGELVQCTTKGENDNRRTPHATCAPALTVLRPAGLNGRRGT